MPFFTGRVRRRALLGLAGVVMACGICVRASTPKLWGTALLPAETAAPSLAATLAPRQTSAPTASPEAAQAEIADPAEVVLADHGVAEVIFTDTTQPQPEQSQVTSAPPIAMIVDVAYAQEEYTEEFPEVISTAEPDAEDTPLYAYETETVRVEIREHSIKNTVYFTAEIWLTDASQLRSAFSSDRFDGATEPVRDIADRNGAVLAINGDFATFNNGGIIIRNGSLFRSNRSTRQLLVIDKNGNFIPYVDPPDNAAEAAAAFVADGAWQTLVFGPVLVENGEAVPLPKEFFISTGAAVEPRTAIGQLGPLHYLWIVVDGRQDGYSRGVSLSRLQELFIEHGVQTAFNLDGGGSTTLYFNGNIINRPANGGQRHVPDILYIAR